MKPMRRNLLVGVLLLGVLLTTGGMLMWVRTEYGTTFRFIGEKDHRIPGKGYFWTWGYPGYAKDLPDAWHFHVIFSANGTADIVLLWNVNESILFEKSGAKLDLAFDVAIPRTTENWTWDWLITNPNDLAIVVDNLTVIHNQITYPERQLGSVILGAGNATVLGAVVGLVYSRRHDIPP